MTNEERRATLLLITEKLNACIVQILSQDDEGYRTQSFYLCVMLGLTSRMVDRQLDADEMMQLISDRLVELDSLVPND